MSARRRFSSLLLLLAITGAGCRTALPPPRQPITPAASRAIDLLAERWRQFTGLRTLADIAVQRGRERYQLRGVLLAKPPSSVRFEALSPMGQPLLLATIHDGQITGYDATTDEAVVGPATTDATAEVLKLPLEADDLVAVLVGRPVPPLDVRTAEILPADQMGPSIELVGQVNRRRIWLDLETGVARQVEITGGRSEARVRYHRDADGELTGLDLTAMMDYVTASVRYQNPAFGVALEADLFELAIPKSAKIRYIR